MHELLTREDYAATAAGLNLPSNAYINGKFVKARSGRTFETVNPATGEVLTSVASCGAVDVDYAVKKARQAFESNSELYALRLEYTRLVHELRTKQSEGTLVEEDVAELRTLEHTVNDHEVTKELSEAQIRMVEVLQRCNTVISERLGFDYASSAATQRSCGC